MKRITIASLALVLVAALLVTGCGAKTSSTGTKGQMTPQQVVQKSNQKMQSVRSLKITGMGDVTEGGKSGKTELESKYDSTDTKNPKGILIVQGVENETIYALDGYIYTNSGSEGWVKVRADKNISRTITFSPEELSNLSKSAKNLKMLTDSGNSYQIAFDIGKGYYDQELKQLNPDVAKILQGILCGVKAVFKISKSTFYLDGLTLKMDVKDFGAFGKVGFNMNFAFSDYNVPVTVSLPPEAKSAEEVPANPENIPGLPGLPGL